jgi:hypothetical protein
VKAVGCTKSSSDVHVVFESVLEKEELVISDNEMKPLGIGSKSTVHADCEAAWDWVAVQIVID